MNSPLTHTRILSASITLLSTVLVAGQLAAAPSPIGTGLKSGVTLGALVDPSKVIKVQPYLIDYTTDLNTQLYDIYIPPSYDGSKPYGIMVYLSPGATGTIMQSAADTRNLIWIAPRGGGNTVASPQRTGPAVMAIYRAKELFNIDSRRVYTTGLSGGGRMASELALASPALIRGAAPSSGAAFAITDTTPSFVPDDDGRGDTYSGYLACDFPYSSNVSASTVIKTAIASKQRQYLLTRYTDFRRCDIFTGYYTEFVPNGVSAYLSLGPGGHQDASDAEIKAAIDWLDRNDTFPINATATSKYVGLQNISQTGASYKIGTSAVTLTPSSSAAAALKSTSTFNWDNAGGSTVRWLWEVKSTAPTNQKTTFGVWLNGQTWTAGIPNDKTDAPRILVTLSQSTAGKRITFTAKSAATAPNTVLFDGTFNFVPAYGTEFTTPKLGYLSGSPVDVRLELNRSGYRLILNGISVATTSAIAAGTELEPNYKRTLFGSWNAAVGGASFWKYDTTNPANNTWNPKAIATIATESLIPGSGTPAPLNVQYLVISDPNVTTP